MKKIPFLSSLLLSLTSIPLWGVEPGSATPANLEVGARPGEEVVIPALRGIICVPDTAAIAAAVPPSFSGADVSQTPLMQRPDAAELLGLFLNRPASVRSLGRLEIAVRTWLRAHGESFVVVYLPPQDITSGVVRIVVHRATLEGELGITGAKWFAESYYRGAIALRAGDPIDTVALQRGLDELNANSYHRVRLVAERGSGEDTTRLRLVADERFPFTFSASYDNTGTAITGEERVGAGVSWGNAFGRGDSLNYRFSADPDFEHAVSHFANYGMRLAGKRTLTFFGAWSKIESLLPPPLTQTGHSWQLGTRYTLPLTAPGEGWTQNFTFGGDFKYSDNNLEFAAIPVTDNATHIVQAGATYGLYFSKARQRAAFSASVFASPGGLSSRNHGRYFEVSRPGAKAGYVYGQLTAQYSRGLPGGASWLTSATGQMASGALLGSEQLNGGGSGAVRGYRESSAFGDYGVVVNNELHAPPVTVAGLRLTLDPFGFVDFASLGLEVDDQSTDLRSAGLGANLQVLDHLSVRFAYGWQLKKLDNHHDESGRGHVAANLTW